MAIPTGFSGPGSAPGTLAFELSDGSTRELLENDDTRRLADTLAGKYQPVPEAVGAAPNVTPGAFDAPPPSYSGVPGASVIQSALGGVTQSAPVPATRVVPGASEIQRAIASQPSPPPMQDALQRGAPGPAQQIGTARGGPGQMRQLAQEPTEPDAFDQWAAAQRQGQPPEAPWQPTRGLAQFGANAPAPPGMAMGGESRKKGVVLPEGYDEEAIADAVIDRKLAAQTAYEAKQEEIKANQQELARQQGEMAAEQEELKRVKAQYAAELQARKMDYDDSLKAVDEHEIDVDRLFKGRPVARFMSAIASGLGAYAAAMTGTKNFAQETLNQAIDRDIAEQKMEAAKRRGQAGEAKNAYEYLIQSGRTPEAAEAQLRGLALRQSKNRLEQLMGSSELLANDSNLQNTLAGLEEQGFQNVANYANLVQGEVRQQFVVPQVQAIGGGGGGGAAGSYKPYFEEEQEMRQFQSLSSQEKAQLSLKHKKDVNEYGKKLEKIADVTGTIREVEQLMMQEAKRQGVPLEEADQPGIGFGHTLLRGMGADTLSGALAGESGRRLQNLQAMMVEKMTTAITGAVASPEQVKRFKQILGNGSIFEGDMLQGIQNFKALLQDVSASARQSTPAIVRVIHRAQSGGGRGYLDPKASGKFEPARE